ncbi:MAG: urease accessory UreF family protein [Acidovorax sp.]
MSALLHLIWLASPALPVGGFSYSEGLEIAVERAGVTTEQAASDWIAAQLHLTQARGDMAVVAQTVQAWRAADHARVRALNDWVLHTRETQEMRLQTEQMGRSLTEWLRNRHAHEPERLPDVQRLAELPPTYPVAFALAAAPLDASAHDVLLAYTFGWAENMVQAALKAVPLGQSAGQRILARLADAIPAAAHAALGLPDERRQAFSPMLAILSAQHETQYTRLFRS